MNRCDSQKATKLPFLRQLQEYVWQFDVQPGMICTVDCPINANFERLSAPMSMTSDSRLNFRLPSELKQIIEQAAGHLGQTVSEFAVSTLVQTAHQVIEQRDRTNLTSRDREVFLSMLDNVDAQPNAALIAAAEEYRKQRE
jgi:uncharacterized protein (DUF1778 family)